MQATGTKRKLAAILAADVVGYSRLMGDDDEATVEALTESRRLFASHIEQHHGRIVNAPGDSILAEFASVVDAVACAVEVQRALAERNHALPEHRRMEFRIGVNLGDVIVKEDAIYGDGVNIAARLEGLAEAGGICISRMVHDNVKGRLPVEFEYLGEHQVKNIDEPVRVYRVSTGVKKAPSGAALSAPVPALPDQPSIAVLPFESMGGDPDQAWFSDGLTETIITDLSKLKNLFVIARNSSFVYKGRAVDVRQIGRELGVQHILEGSIQRAANRVRINAQLTEANSGRHIWAERYDRNLDDLFELQDDITQKIVAALKVEIAEGESDRIKSRTPPNVEAWELVQRGWSVWQAHQSCESLELHGRLMSQSAALDPNYSTALVGLAWNALLSVTFACTNDPDGALAEALHLSEQACESNKFDADASLVLALSSLFARRYPQAISASERAIDLAPNRAGILANVAWGMIYLTQVTRSIELMSRAIRLNPHHPPWYKGIYGMAHFWDGDIAAATKLISETLERLPNHIFMPVYSMFLHHESGEIDEAKRWARSIRRMKPEFDAEYWLTYCEPYRERVDADRVRAIFVAVGIT